MLTLDENPWESDALKAAMSGSDILSISWRSVTTYVEWPDNMPTQFQEGAGIVAIILHQYQCLRSNRSS